MVLDTELLANGRYFFHISPTGDIFILSEMGILSRKKNEKVLVISSSVSTSFS